MKNQAKKRGSFYSLLLKGLTVLALTLLTVFSLGLALLSSSVRNLWVRTLYGTSTIEPQIDPIDTSKQSE